ncbi:hypothetical protein [Salinicola avicenniae]|uniref:hypothetical protein n=1 Tax=Salinicola avicenniae TaxID=2916836 RepID=UPI002073FDF2|nr:MULTISPECIES: hypothetical protein [unclassified Salinicola]
MSIMNNILGGLGGLSGTLNSAAGVGANLQGTEGASRNTMGELSQAYSDYMDFSAEAGKTQLEIGKMTRVEGMQMQAASKTDQALDKYQ